MDKEVSIDVNVCVVPQLSAERAWEQQHPTSNEYIVLISWCQMLNESELLEKMTDSRAGAGKEHDEPGSS